MAASAARRPTMDVHAIIVVASSCAEHNIDLL